MIFTEWSALMTERLRRRFPELELLDAGPGICYVLGKSSIDMVELHGAQVLLVPHSDPLTLVDGVLRSRHQGVKLESVRRDLTDEGFSEALRFIREHLTPKTGLPHAS